MEYLQQWSLVGLGAAVQAIWEDDRMSPETKEKGIDWLEEGEQIGRPFAVEVIKAMFRGELPFFEDIVSGIEHFRKPRGPTG